MTAPDAPLPRLHPLLTLRRAPDGTDGKPGWTLHDPLSNDYYRIGWAEFECLSRFSRARTASHLKSLVETETTVRVSEDDITSLVEFLQSKGLLALRDQKIQFTPRKPVSWLKRIIHGYLFFTIPLFKPDEFLQRTLPLVRPLLSRGFIMAMIGVLAVSVLMTMQRADEFFNTFTALMSWEGALLIMLSFFVVKIIHEMAHAYTAAHYGVPVPHMGIAFMVMYPVLYTEVTGSWRLPSRTARLHIGMAGVMAELCLAGIALIAWNMLPYGGAGQAIAFSIAAVSLVGSLLINLNPLMRFDGYYMLSDYSGFDNLQARACAFARWKLRRVLFSLPDEAPETLKPAQQDFLTFFGFALLIYRFFLFLGIAILVYHVFFKPLGAILMAVELLYFIGLPVLNEIKIWWKRRADILSTARGKIAAATMAGIALFLFVPVTQTAMIPAVIHGGTYRSVYAPAPARIVGLAVEEGQAVREGDLLISLESPELSFDIASAQRKLESLEMLKRRGQTQAQTAQHIGDIDSRLAEQRVVLSGLQERASRLQLYAPFNGMVRDVHPLLEAGRFISQEELLFRLIDETQMEVTGYASEADVASLSEGMNGSFYPEGDALSVIPLMVRSVDKTDAGVLAWAELASVYGGPVPSQQARESGGAPVPLTTLYNVRFTPEKDADIYKGVVRAGRVRVLMPQSSIISKFFNKLYNVWWREAGLN